jgi:hypothetical protein
LNSFHVPFYRWILGVHWFCYFIPSQAWLATGRWFSPDPPVSSTNKTERHDITEILLKVALNIIKQTINVLDFLGPCHERLWWNEITLCENSVSTSPLAMSARTLFLEISWKY